MKGGSGDVCGVNRILAGRTLENERRAVSHRLTGIGEKAERDGVAAGGHDAVGLSALRDDGGKRQAQADVAGRTDGDRA